MTIEEQLKKNAHISNKEIAKDIEDTEKEILDLQNRIAIKQRIIDNPQSKKHELTLARLFIDSYKRGIHERRIFIEKLTILWQARLPQDGEK